MNPGSVSVAGARNGVQRKEATSENKDRDGVQRKEAPKKARTGNQNKLQPSSSLNGFELTCR